MSFNQVWSGFVIASTTGLIVEHLMAVETSFPRGVLLDMQDTSETRLR